MLKDEDFEMIHKAIILARDAAFLNTGDKNHRYVKEWERLRDRVDEERTAAYFERR